MGVLDAERYQTVYAERRGSIAAPTAGLHFTEDLLDRISLMGVTIVKITLHIGVGTFFLVKKERVEEHRMHREYYSVQRHMLELIRDAKARGKGACRWYSAVRTLRRSVRAITVTWVTVPAMAQVMVCAMVLVTAPEITVAVTMAVTLAPARSRVTQISSSTRATGSRRLKA